jgi:DNA ligase-1
MLSFEETAVTLHGHEGIMLRSMDGPYKFGRSTEREGYLLKVKRFTDGEAVIIGMEELYHNKNEAFTGELGQTKRRGLQENMVAGGIMGKLCVRDLKTGVEFNIGTGYTALQRKVWWRLRSKMKGRIVKYRFQEHGVKNKPRIASFVGFRDPRDMWNSTNQQ